MCGGGGEGGQAGGGGGRGITCGIENRNVHFYCVLRLSNRKTFRLVFSIGPVVTQV